MSQVLRVGPVATLQGELRPPSDKSLTHRAYILAALAEDRCQVDEPLRSEDCDATLRCLAALGRGCDLTESNQALIWPNHEWQTPEEPLYCGNSGTTMRLLSGLIASLPGVNAVMTGDASLSRRPMRRIAEPLRLMGADVEGETAPLTIRGKKLTGIEYASPVASAQVKSCVLLAGLRANGETWVTEPTQSRDHTERMLAALGVEVMHKGETAVGVRGGASWDGFHFRVPADISSAAFFMVAAAMLPEARVTLLDVGVNPTRTGIFDVFRQAGVRWRLESERKETGEPVADLVVEGGAPLRAFEIAGAMVPRLIDEIPVLAVLATQCDGVTRIRDAHELRVKESDRIVKVAEGLRAMGARVETYDDGMDVEGPVKLQGATIEAEGDHRIAMAFAVAGLVAEGATTITGAESIATSYPDFEKDLVKVSVL